MLNVFIISLICLSFITSCQNRPKPDGQKTEEDFAVSTKSFPVTASEQRQNQLRIDYPKLELGMSKQQVVAVIGNPDYSHISISPRDYSQSTGSSWNYIFYCTGRFCGTTSEDKLIEVSFDLNDKVDWIKPSENSGLVEKRLNPNE